jgi:hypothetical protein
MTTTGSIVCDSITSSVSITSTTTNYNSLSINGTFSFGDDIFLTNGTFIYLKNSTDSTIFIGYDYLNEGILLMSPCIAFKNFLTTETYFKCTSTLCNINTNTKILGNLEITGTLTYSTTTLNIGNFNCTGSTSFSQQLNAYYGINNYNYRIYNYSYLYQDNNIFMTNGSFIY